MRILFFILSVILLSSCSALQKDVIIIDEPNHESKSNLLTEPLIKEDCIVFPYDNSNTPCNLLGWQSFTYQSLTHTKKAHQAALLLLGNEPGVAYKQLILLSNKHETLEVRSRAKAAMFNISKTNLNNFGHFFYMLAIYNEHDLLNEKSALQLKAELKKVNKKNIKLTNELNNAQSKIEAIMDIEKNLNTN